MNKDKYQRVKVEPSGWMKFAGIALAAVIIILSIKGLVG